jgi:hypothetical protein
VHRGQLLARRLLRKVVRLLVVLFKCSCSNAVGAVVKAQVSAALLVWLVWLVWLCGWCGW